MAGYAFHQSFGAAADALTHGALALAVLAAATLAWRHHRSSRRNPVGAVPLAPER
jgi:hypothetical protein